ncbi:HAD family hydrolase [Geomicrobium sp. JCM 19038]|uniref:HAD family hydrolase n=1 Tax=Geomicrobium sp. JCM 19038 TaxID=1460635 RepID=UPI00045F4A9B|nr:HAD family hydrolase [Geomicrobium sp. JCM 19038]GAK06728.1 2-haloalkanoic acid dehalogenase [Geomicrobium sp. JCM 19038]
MINTLIFDLDDTLLWDKKSIKEALLATCNDAYRIAGIDADLLFNAVKEVAPIEYKKQDFYPVTVALGINPFEGLWGNFNDVNDSRLRQMGDSISVYQFDVWMESLRSVGNEDLSLARKLAKRFITYRETLPYVYEDTFDVLSSLQKTFQLVLLTNGAPSLQQKKLQMTPALVPFFNRIFISGSFGVGKPDTSLFNHCLSQLNIKPEEAVMIGDNLHTDIIGGNGVNLTTVWINREGSSNDTDIIPTIEIKNLRELNEVLERISI